MTQPTTPTSGARLTTESANARFMQGIAYHRGGLFDRAQGVYDEVLTALPLHFGALHFSGVLAFQQGQAQRAVELISKAVGVFDGDGSAFCNLANAQRSLGLLPQALDNYTRALVLLPDHFSSIYGRGCVLFGLGKVGDALTDFKHALTLQPQNADVLSNAGNCQAALGQTDAAMASYAQAIALNPDHLDAHYNRGLLLGGMGEFMAALSDYDRALAVQPNHYDALVNRANILLAFHRSAEAVTGLRQATVADPSRFEGWYNLANALAETGDTVEQLRACLAAQAIDPTVDFVAGSVLNLQMKLCEWSTFDADLQRLLADVTAGRLPVQPFALLALADAPALQLRTARQLSAKLTKSIAPRPADLFQPPRPGLPLRIGYFSSDFCNHAVASQLSQLLLVHDRQVVEVFAFSFTAKPEDPMQQRIALSVDHFHDVSLMSDREVAALARSLAIDIAVDLNGYTNKARPTIFALGCAPVQTAYLGYAGTTGAPYIDYLIADRVLIPEENRQHYSEHVVYLPDSFMVNDNTRLRSDRQFTRAELGLPEQGFVFRCYNSAKILPEVFNCWMRLLQQVPGSVLWLLDENATATANLRREAQQRGIDPARLVFSGRVEMSEHFARNRIADLFLDTFPYTAHSTACDALWSGLPVLTRMGESFASRVAGSLLSAMGLPELITHSVAEYEARALHLAQHPHELAALRERLIASRDSGPLFNTETFARRIEAAYTLMHRRRVDGLPPAHLDVSTTDTPT